MWSILPDDLVHRVGAVAATNALPVLAALDRRGYSAASPRLRRIVVLAKPPFSLSIKQILGGGVVQLGGFSGPSLHDPLALQLAAAISSGAFGMCAGLSFGHNCLRKAGVIALAEAFTTNAFKINTLDLAFNDFGDEGLIALAHASARGALPNLMVLGLDGGDVNGSMEDGGQIGDAGLIALCKAAIEDGAFSLLERLYLTGNRFGDTGHRDLATCIAYTDGFTSLQAISINRPDNPLYVNELVNACHFYRVPSIELELNKGDNWSGSEGVEEDSGSENGVWYSEDNGVYNSFELSAEAS